ncbi:unnamed protein product [Schistocephalus solidus]|uniref:Cyclic nucleotide-binding domain-containing protein n=1 Tax=Schistocephalus solidus TaxID=70667 RepID=A0A183T674_SCHSO|nr:unnamed protein product [Schistocephalus solidus]
MLVAVVREAGQVVLSDGEILDAWSVILNGTVETLTCLLFSLRGDSSLFPHFSLLCFFSELFDVASSGCYLPSFWRISSVSALPMFSDLASPLETLFRSNICAFLPPAPLPPEIASVDQRTV